MLYVGLVIIIGKIIEDFVGDGIDVLEFLYDVKLDLVKDGFEIGVMKGLLVKLGIFVLFYFVVKFMVNFFKDV